MNRLLLAALLVLVAPLASAQQSTPASSFNSSQRAEIVAIVRSALKTDPSILRDAVLALQQQQADTAAAASVQAVKTNRQAILATPGDPIAGNPNGSVTLVEFFDVRCPYCRRMLPDMTRLLHDDGDVRLILKDLPILGPASLLATRALLAAQSQGGYLKLQAALMANGVTIDDATLRRTAVAAGLDWPRLQTDMAAPAVTARIDANLALASKLGIEGTPALVVGDQMVSGAMTLDELKKAVASLRR